MGKTIKGYKGFSKSLQCRGKQAPVCATAYGRACQSKSFADLAQVIKDHFHYAVKHGIIDASLISKNKEEFAENNIYCNENVFSGFLLACGDAHVEAWDNSRVEASGYAYILNYTNSGVDAGGYAIVRDYSNNTICIPKDAKFVMS
jgi:hypothetical protein